jgi:hypothetical protein
VPLSYLPWNKADFVRVHGKLTALTFSTETVRYAVTLKWLPIVFMRLIQSQRIVTVTAKYGYGKIRYGYMVGTYLYGT